MGKPIILSDLFRQSWKSLWAQIWVLSGLLIGYVIIGLLLNAFIPPSDNHISVLFHLVFTLGYTKNMFQALDGEEPQFSAYGQMSRKIFIYFFASVIYAIVVCAGLFFLIVPGIYLALRLQFFPMSIVEENTGVVGSLKRSWEITRSSTLKLFLLMLVLIGLMLAGFALFLIGIFVALPLCGLMSCYAFRRLTVSTTS